MITFVYSRDKGVFPNTAALRDEVRKAMVSEFIPIAADRAAEQIPRWGTPRTFVVYTGTGTENLIVALAPHESWADYWWYSSDGVKGHFIRPRQRGLRVPGPKGYKYTPSLKFTPSKVGLSGGYSYEAFSKGHWWPGIPPKEFGANIRPGLEPIFMRVCNAGVKRGIIAAQKTGH